METCHSSSGGELFKTTDGLPVMFSLSPLCPERKDVQTIVETWGGAMTGISGGPHTIRLAPSTARDCATSKIEDVFKLQYIYDCVEAQELLDIKDYRVRPSIYTNEVDAMDILLGNRSWKEAKRLMDRRGGNGTEDGHVVPLPRLRPRPNYTVQEEKAILHYIIEQCRFDEVKGKTLWVDMEQAKVCPGRSWGSMKERFKKYIVPNIQQFKMKPSFAKKLSESINPGVLKMADLDAASSDEEEAEEKNNVHNQSELGCKKWISPSDDVVCKRQRVDTLPQSAQTTHNDKENNFSGCEENNSVLQNVIHERQLLSSVDNEVILKQSQNKNPDISSSEQSKDSVLQVRENPCGDTGKMDCVKISSLADGIQRSPINLSQKRATNSCAIEQTDTIISRESTHKSKYEVPEHNDKHIKHLRNFDNEQGHENASKHRDESMTGSVHEHSFMKLDSRPTRLKERAITKKLIDGSLSVCAAEKVVEVDEHKKENERENSCHECENCENYEATNRTNLHVIKSAHISLVPKDLPVVPKIGSNKVRFAKTISIVSTMDTSSDVQHGSVESQVEQASVGVPSKQGVQDNLSNIPEHLLHGNAVSAESQTKWDRSSSVEEVDSDSFYAVHPSPKLFEIEEVFGNKESRKIEESEGPSSKQLKFMEALQLKKRDEKVSDVQVMNKRGEESCGSSLTKQKRHSMMRTCTAQENRIVDLSFHKDGKTLSDSVDIVESSDEERESCVQVMKKNKKLYDSMEIVEFSDEDELSSDSFTDTDNSVRTTKGDSQKDEEYRPQTTKFSLPEDEKSRHFRIVKSKYFIKREGSCEKSPEKCLKGLGNRVTEPEDIEDVKVEMNVSDSDSERFHKYSRKIDSVCDIKVNSSDLKGRPSTHGYGRQYTMKEDVAILAFIQDCDGYSRVGGNQLWKEMERSRILNKRTWHSLKERYRKVIIQRLYMYANTELVKEAVKVLKAKDTTLQGIKKEQEVRRPYTRTEDYLILQFIIDNNRYSEVGGKSMWEQMSLQPGLGERTWLSLKERFRRVITRNLSDYEVSSEARYRFSKWLKTHTLKKEETT